MVIPPMPVKLMLSKVRSIVPKSRVQYIDIVTVHVYRRLPQTPILCIYKVMLNGAGICIKTIVWGSATTKKATTAAKLSASTAPRIKIVVNVKTIHIAIYIVSAGKSRAGVIGQ